MKDENQSSSDPLEKELKRMMKKLKSEKDALSKILRNSAEKQSTVKPKKS